MQNLVKSQNNWPPVNPQMNGEEFFGNAQQNEPNIQVRNHWPNGHMFNDNLIDPSSDIFASGNEWNSSQQPQQQQQLSIVTTVWGATQGTQSVPFQHQSQLPHFSKQFPYMSQSQPNQSFRPNGNFGVSPARANMGGGSTFPHPLNPSNQDSALNTAAIVAAATATATASVVALHDQYPQNSFIQKEGLCCDSQTNCDCPAEHPYGIMGSSLASSSCNPGGQFCNNTGGALNSRLSMGKSLGIFPNSGSYNMPRRMQPYPNPQQYVSAKRAAYFASNQQMSSMNSFNNFSNVPFSQSLMPYNSQTRMRAPTVYGPSANVSANSLGQFQNSSLFNNGSNSMQNQQYILGPNSPVYPQMLNGEMVGQCSEDVFVNDRLMIKHAGHQLSSQYGQANGSITSHMFPLHGSSNPSPFANSAMSGNPMTPSPHMSRVCAGMLGDVKPQIMPQPLDEPRLTFCVRDGMILPPFRLEHNLQISHHGFFLKPSVHQTIMSRSDLELQLKCFHHEDRQMITNWPQSVRISVNNQHLLIDRPPDGKPGALHRPLNIKRISHPGRNTIDICAAQCCCSHLFLLQLVHRPPVKSVLQGLLRKRLLSVDQSLLKIKRSFTSQQGIQDECETSSIKISLRCPITARRILIPARGQDCKHVPCFDLEAYLHMNAERPSWRCPLCSRSIILEMLEIDQFIWGILNNAGSAECDEVIIDSQGCWKSAASKFFIKEEPGNPMQECKYYKLQGNNQQGQNNLNLASWQRQQSGSPFATSPYSPRVVTPCEITSPLNFNNHTMIEEFQSDKHCANSTCSTNGSQSQPSTPVSQTTNGNSSKTSSNGATTETIPVVKEEVVDTHESEANEAQTRPASVEQKPSSSEQSETNTEKQINLQGDFDQIIKDVNGLVDGDSDISNVLNAELLQDIDDPSQLTMYLGPENSSENAVCVNSTADDILELLEP